MTTLLSKICDLIVDCEHKTAPTCLSGYPSIRTPNVGRGRLILDGVNYVDEATYRYWTKRAVPRPGDLIIAREAPVGNVALIVHDQTVCLGQRTVLVRPSTKIVDAQYLTYFLLGNYAQNYFYGCSIGATVPHLNMRDIRSIPIPDLPPLDDQRRIAGILSAYDDLIEVNTRRITILEEMARRLFDEWFIKCRFPGKGRLKEVEEVPLRAVADFVKGRKPEETKQAPSRGDVPLLLIDALRGGRPVFTSPVGLVLVEKRDTIMVMDGGSSCDVALGFSGALGSTLGRFRTIDGARFSNHALYRFLESKVDEFKLKNIGSAIPHANKDYILQQRVKLLPQSMNEKLDSLLEPVQAAAEVLRSANQQLRAARDLLLPKLISGEVDVSGTKRQAKRAVKRAAAE